MIRQACLRLFSPPATLISLSGQRTLMTSVIRRGSSDGRPSEGLVIREDLSHGTTVLTLNNPKKMNILSLEMLNTLRDSLKGAISSETTKSIILRSTGVCFCAGHDLKELRRSEGTDQHQEIFDTCTEVMTMLEDSPVPTIAEVNGLATAAGCQMVASCDIVIATDKSRFGLPGVKVGLFCSTPAVAVGRHLPRKVIMHMLLTGDTISAQDALTHGLITKMTTEEDLHTVTMETAMKMSTTSRAVKTLGKTVFKSQMSTDRDQAYCIATGGMMENLRVVDCQEGIASFVEKREANWNDKYDLLPENHDDDKKK